MNPDRRLQEFVNLTPEQFMHVQMEFRRMGKDVPEKHAKHGGHCVDFSVNVHDGMVCASVEKQCGGLSVQLPVEQDQAVDGVEGNAEDALLRLQQNG